MDNDPPDTGGAESQPDWQVLGDLDAAEDLENNPVYQATTGYAGNLIQTGHPQNNSVHQFATDYTGNPIHTGPLQVNPQHPSRVQVSDHGSPMRPRVWQSMARPGWQNTGTNPHTNSHPYAQGMNPPMMGAPQGMNLSTMGHPQGMNPPTMGAFQGTNPRTMGRPQGMNPPTMGRPQGMNLPTMGGASEAGYSGRVFGSDTNHFGPQTPFRQPVPGNNQVIQQQQLYTPVPPMAVAPRSLPPPQRINWGSILDRPANIPPRRTVVGVPASTARPTAAAVRADVRFHAPRSIPYERFPADHPIPETVVEMEKGWDSGLNHFALFGDETEPRLKYRMKLIRGRKQSGGRQGGAYSENHPAPTDLLPARLGLTSFTRNYPNHCWGQGVRLLMAEGIKAETLWRRLPKEVRHNSDPKRPWNYLQHTYGRETHKMIEEETGVKPRIKPRGKRTRPSDDVGREGSSKKKKRTSVDPADPAPTPTRTAVPMVADCPPPELGTDLRHLSAHQRWQFIPPHQHMADDLRCKWGHKRAVCKEVMRRVLSEKDPEFERRSTDFQMRHLDNALDLLSAQHAHRIRVNNNIPEAESGGLNNNQFYWAQAAVARNYRREEDESEKEYRERLTLMAWRSMLGWIEQKTDTFRQELGENNPPLDSDSESEPEGEPEGDDSEGEEEEPTEG